MYIYLVWTHIPTCMNAIFSINVATRCGMSETEKTETPDRRDGKTRPDWLGWLDEAVWERCRDECDPLSGRARVFILKRRRTPPSPSLAHWSIAVVFTPISLSFYYYYYYFFSLTITAAAATAVTVTTIASQYNRFCCVWGFLIFFFLLLPPPR